MAKEGAKHRRKECRLVVVIDEAYRCTACDLVCCDVPMKEVMRTIYGLMRFSLMCR